MLDLLIPTVLCGALWCVLMGKVFRTGTKAFVAILAALASLGVILGIVGGLVASGAVVPVALIILIVLLGSSLRPAR